MKSLKKLFYKYPSLKNGFIIMVGTVIIPSIISAIITMVSENIWYFIVGCVTVIIITTLLVIVTANPFHKIDILEIVKKESEEEHWIEVIRFAFPISRPLWIRKNFDLRIELGNYIYDSLLKINDDKILLGGEAVSKNYILSSVLIDDLGWTRHERYKNDNDAENNILRGIKIAKDNHYYDLEIKGYRHLIGIYADDEKKEESEKKRLLETTINNILSLSKVKKVKEKHKYLVASANLSIARYYCLEKKYEEASKIAEEANKTLAKSYDYEKYVESFLILGQIQISDNKIDNARITLEEGLEKAKTYQIKKSIVEISILLINIITENVIKWENNKEEDVKHSKNTVRNYYSNALKICYLLQDKESELELKKCQKYFLEQLKEKQKFFEIKK